MDLERLRSVRDRGREAEHLIELPESFYQDVHEYIADLKERRDEAAAEADDPFTDPRVQQLSDELKTANHQLEAICDIRSGKIVKAASLAAADLPAGTEQLTREEKELFEDLVDSIEGHRSQILTQFDMESPAASSE